MKLKIYKTLDEDTEIEISIDLNDEPTQSLYDLLNVLREIK